ncbi:MAG: hypothetical protein HY226_02575 [Candidatus Vogelbacteria bacterium]|nr:hypothetical protein [Candidatus Vogelbacteria bacterium]
MFGKIQKEVNKMFVDPVMIKDDLGLDLNVYRDWEILCVFFVFIFLAIFVLDLYIFYQGDFFAGGVSFGQLDAVSNFSENKLNTVMREWEDRVNKFNVQADIVPKVIDPSL